MARRTKIVATIGPASSSPEVLGRLIDAGMSVVRLNLSHGDVPQYLELIERVRAVAAERGTKVGILADLPGPKVRTTDLGKGANFENDSIVQLRSSSEPSTAQNLNTDYPTVARDLRSGDVVKLGDGQVQMRVNRVEGEVVTAVVTHGGPLRARPGLHLPSDRVRMPVPTDEDRNLIEKVVLGGQVDFAAVSFVRNAGEIRTVRSLLGDSGIRIVAKIETLTALENLDEIVIESDAVMVARGDLGIECPFEDVPVYQKRIIRTCLVYATPVITATQMLESMITAATPTRAEASDVANAVADGTDAIMLSGETAIGHDPALVVDTMARIADQAEIVADFDRFAETIGPQRRLHSTTAALTWGAWHAAGQLQVSAILCCTRTGSTAHVMAALRPDARLIALSTNPQTVMQETLTWGVVPLSLPPSTDSDTMVASAVAQALEAGVVQEGDVVAVLSGPRDQAGSTDNLRLLTVGDPIHRGA